MLTKHVYHIQAENRNWRISIMMPHGVLGSLLKLLGSIHTKNLMVFLSFRG